MTKLLLCGAALLASASALCAQSFTAASGYTASPLFSTGPGVSLGAFDIDLAGDIYYLAQITASNDTRLLKRTLASGYATETVLYNFGSNPFPSFVEVSGSTVYFGESSTGQIRAVPTAGGTSSLIASVTGAYDLAFRGSTAFLSADPTFSNNQVFRLDLSTGVLDRILDTGGDFSGPTEFDLAGNLLYGASSSPFGGLGTGNIFRLSAAEVDAAINADPLVSDTFSPLSAAVIAIDNGNNLNLAYRSETHLFRTDSPFGSPGIATRYDLTTQSAEAVGQTGSGDFLSGAVTDTQSLYLAVSNGSSSTVIRVVPEPSAIFCLGAGLAGILARRRRSSPSA